MKIRLTFFGCFLSGMLGCLAIGSETSLEKSYIQIKAEATRLAGAPDDIPQRVGFLYAIYNDSHGNHAFPLIALHGALWAKTFFDRTGPIGKKIGWRYFYNSKERDRRWKMIDQFSTSFKDANRLVFIDTYTNYYFTKKFGSVAGAEKIIEPELLQSLNSMHEAAKAGRTLSSFEMRKVFVTSLMWEQESSVAPKVIAAIAAFDCPILRYLSMKPIVAFQYFPQRTKFRFSNFSNKPERIQKAIWAYDLAESAGWSKVVESIQKYHLIDGATLENTENLKNVLLNSCEGKAFRFQKLKTISSNFLKKTTSNLRGDFLGEI